MKHFDDDQLLKHALDADDDVGTRAEIDAHLQECDGCRERLEILAKDIRTIGSLRPYRRIIKVPARKEPTGIVVAVLRAAALLLVGIALGYSVSEKPSLPRPQVASGYIVRPHANAAIPDAVAPDATIVPVDR